MFGVGLTIGVHTVRLNTKVLANISPGSPLGVGSPGEMNTESVSQTVGDLANLRRSRWPRFQGTGFNLTQGTQGVTLGLQLANPFGVQSTFL